MDIRRSIDGQTFTEFGFDFDETTPFPASIPVDPNAEALEIFQIWTGPSVP